MRPRALLMLLSGIVAMAVLGAGVALAEQCSGYDVGVSQVAETTELAKGHTITVIRAHSMVVTDNPADKYNLTIGLRGPGRGGIWLWSNSSPSHRDAITTSTARKTSSPARGCPSVLRSELALATDDPQIFRPTVTVAVVASSKGRLRGAYRKGTTTSKEDRTVAGCAIRRIWFKLSL